MNKLKKLNIMILSFTIMLGLVSTVIEPSILAEEVTYAIKPQFDDAGDFSEGLARIRINDKEGFIDKTGKMVIKPQFNYAGDFSEGLSMVAIDGKWGFIDKTGKIIIKPKFIVTAEGGIVTNFSEGFAWAWDEVKHKYGYMKNPIIKVITISLNKTADSLKIGSKDLLIATVKPTNATNKNVTWKSSNSSVVKVDNTGKITAINKGTAIITVTSVDGGKKATCKVTVKK